MKSRSRNVILVDIDHTIRNSFWRDSMLGSSPWDEYHLAGMKDVIYPDMVDLLHDLYAAGWELHGLTAIEEKWRVNLMKYLVDNDVLLHNLHMRQKNDYARSHLLKVEQAKMIFGEPLSKTIAFVLDDNDAVTAAFRAEGVAVLQVHQRRD